MSDLEQLADRIENAVDPGELDALCRALADYDPHPNVNGSCASYFYSLTDAKRLIPQNHLFSVCHDANEVRAVVALQLTERGGGFSAMPHSRYAETRAIVAASLRARKGQG